MEHPKDSQLVWYALGDSASSEIADHWELCETCSERVATLRRTLERVEEHQVPDLGGDQRADIFAAAWVRSDRARRVRPPLFWTRVLQPVAFLACGLLLGFFLFSGGGTTVAPVGESVGGVLAEGSSSPVVSQLPVQNETPSPPSQVASVAAVRTPSLEETSGKTFWEMAGLRNVKLTPTVRYENDRRVEGAVLEGETLTGALVVLTF